MATTPDPAPVRAVLRRLEEAWERGDGTAYGAEFTPDASYVTFVGTRYRGAEEIGRSHDVMFASFLKGTRLVTQELELTFPGPDVAVVVTRGDNVRGAQVPRQLPKVQTYTLVRDDADTWRIVSFQNTRRRGLVEAISFRLQPASRSRATV